ncbi:hypothetical protein [Paludibaculum fermentans]|uniref:hypothetical protein n=1 Tax=Paludibaculum fermentans TaxID=1473598 RepID=UPI003EBA869B
MDLNLVYIASGALLNALILGIWKPWGSGYAGEKGRNFARKEDLSEILSEVRAVTAAQKAVEAKLSGDLWHHQMRWNQKKEIYGALIHSLQELLISLSELSADTQTLNYMNNSPNINTFTPEHKRKAFDKVTTAFQKTTQSKLLFINAFSLSVIFNSDESNQLLSDYKDSWVEFDILNEKLDAWADFERDKLHRLWPQLIQCAKRDLGVAPLGQAT